MKITAEEFNEMQRWIHVRDYTLEACNLIRLAKDLANGHNYDKDKAIATEEFLTELTVKAIDKIGKFLEEKGEQDETSN